MGTPNVSIRKHIRRLPGEATEPTSTLVLTSHTSHFVDVRILAESREDGSREPLPNDGNESMSRLDWAFAGISKTTKSEHDNGPSHTVWSHWIDSQTSDPNTDEGDMYDQGDRDTLECGQNVDAETGEVKKYEELWHDVGVEQVGDEEEHVSVVLQAENVASETRAMVVRVGNHVQGMLKAGDKVTVERWQYKSGTWECTAKIGTGSGACSTTFQPDKLKEGGSVSACGMEWDIIELYRWK